MTTPVSVMSSLSLFISLALCLPLLLPLAAAAPGPPGDDLTAADELARKARAAPDDRQAAAVAKALAAYDAVLERRPKDMKLVPRVRRRKATLLKHAGRPREALAEYDAIVGGRARRKDKAKALYDAGRLLERGHDLVAAEARYRRALDDYRDVVRVRADASLARGRVLEALRRPREAERAYRFVVKRCRDEAKACVAAYDALAIMALKADDPRAARRWLRRCTARFEKRATRDDRYGAFVGRLLGEMKAPRALAAYVAPPERDQKGA